MRPRIPRFVADQGIAEHHLGRNPRRRFVAFAGDPQRLHLAGRFHEAGAAVGVVVEVGLRRSHRAQGEGQGRLAAGRHPFQVVAELDVAADLDVDVLEAPAGAFGACAHRGEEGLRVFGNEGGAEPAVGDLARVLERLRAQRRQVDRELRPRRLRHAQRLALASGPGQGVVLAVVRDLLAGEGKLEHVDVLAQAAQRLREGYAVQALDHLGAADAEAEHEAIVRDRCQRHRGHRGHRRRPRRDLHDAGAEPDALGARGEVGEGRHGVGAPRLGRPDIVYAQAVRLDDVLGQLPPVRAGSVGAPDPYSRAQDVCTSGVRPASYWTSVAGT